MKTRTLILLLLIIGIPLGLLVWAAQRIARNERVVLRQQFSTLMEDRLQDINRSIARYFEDTEAELQQLTELDQPDTATLRHLTRTQPRVMQMFLLTPAGELSYPDPSQALNSGEKSFLLRAAKMFTEQQFSGTYAGAEMSNFASSQIDMSNGFPADAPASGSIPRYEREQRLDEAITQQSVADADSYGKPAADEVATKVGVPDSGWFVWYWDRGLNLIYWHRRPAGHIVGVALDRARWMADIIAELPDTSDAASRSSGGLPTCMRLMNAASDVVYQWGNSDDASDAEVVADVPIAAPLASWRLQALVRPNVLPGSGGGIAFGLAGGLLAACIAIGLLGFVLFRDYQHDMREAGRQVSFVNQVSHELKTPLTNIRMYAELLEGDLDQLEATESAQPKKRLDVILSEGQRLSRLIGNVLTFARQNQNALEPNPETCVPDEIIHRVLQRFELSLSALGIQLETHLDSADRLRLDTDFLEQILGNLISNVEKYAADGKSLNVRSRQMDSRLVIDVIDGGPGVRGRDCDRIFDPFVRLNHDIRSTAGTGIGLSIARRLARLHGGDVVLRNSERGCHFEVTLDEI